MTEFNKKQIKILKGQYSAIARSCNVSPQYTGLVIAGKRQQNTKVAKEIVRKAKAILLVLDNEANS